MSRRPVIGPGGKRERERERREREREREREGGGKSGRLFRSGRRSRTS